MNRPLIHVNLLFWIHIPTRIDGRIQKLLVEINCSDRVFVCQ